jgi:hypothetical protein
MLYPLVDTTGAFLSDTHGNILYAEGLDVPTGITASGSSQSSAYRFEVYDGNNQLIADLSPHARSRRFTVRRNRAEQVSLSFDQGQLEDLASDLGLSVRQLLEPGVNDIRISRGNRALVGSQIQYLLPTLSANGRTVEVRAVGYLDLFKDRFLWPGDTLTYVATDIGQIAWMFITISQSRPSGSFGITEGVIQASRTITDTWQPFATSIRDAIIDLTARNNSIDVSFGPDKTFNVYYPGQGTEKADLRFSWPGNIRELSLPVDASELCNYAIVRGKGNGLDQQPIVSVIDPNAIATYRRREALEDQPSVDVIQTLIDKGGERIGKTATPVVIPEITLDGNIEPYLGAYWVGDRVPIAVDASAGSLYKPLDGQTWRINEIDVALNEDDNETVRLKLGYA